ncbi:MAG TPA: 2-amino-4-hydroxy-6-hydroxymethyldihydropteridine diphosphokinase [Candidatus Parabacteroides intestinipullorum]|uniref:2-amino-4-hydroxy-6-hydroxymethyldihydropteridine pyrophosphokinase n=1 Tax=Candidatus Parabacteroides intestinipullorum TaxID=2838723 RepID=A0A9D2BGL0_9BACT|nr:2-amino-4-hydroxy-6-hydroxymethyldihydropteridine diphosphokinase [Candidatus Parabacteroides intestinipullorum]
MAIVYLGLGTNIGNRRGNLVKAAALLAERVGDILALSGFMETEPWGFDSENLFLNAAIKMETPLTPDELLSATQAIEREMGREKKSDGTYHDRVIDIDILLYDNRVIEQPGLIVPHPLMQERLFVMAPLAEIAPFERHPLLGQTFMELADSLRD